MKRNLLKKGIKRCFRTTFGVLIIVSMLISSLGVSNISFAEGTEDTGAVLSMKPFIGSMYKGEAYEEYLKDHSIPVKSAATNSGAWSGSAIENVLKMDNSYWETRWEGSSTTRNWVDVTLTEESTIGRILFAGRLSPLKGFPTGYKIWVASEEPDDVNTPADNSEKWTYVGSGTGKETTDYQEIALPKNTVGKVLRFEWTSWYNTGMSAARIILPLKADSEMENIPEEPEEIEPSENLVMSSFVGNGLTGNTLASYKESYSIPVLSARTNGGQYNGSVGIEHIIVDDNAHWEARSEGNPSNPHWVDITLTKREEIGRLVYGSRNDGAPNKGFPAGFKIWVSDRPNPAIGVAAKDNPEDWRYVGTGTGSPTTSMREIVLPAGIKARTIRFEWATWYNTGMSAGRYLMPYKADNLAEEISALFTDAACTSLASGVTAGKIRELEEKVNSYISPELYRPYVRIAGMLLVNQDFDETIHKPMTLSQRGDRGEERRRTDICSTLGNFDLSGYYVRPGETIQVFCNTDASAQKKPRIVFATLNRNHGAWYQGYDGVELSKGLNTFTIPAERGDCYAIYFYNPALPAEQSFAPVVRLVGGHKYPVYYFDPKLDPSVNKKNQEDFIAYLTEYCKNVADITADALAGRGEANFAEYWSDKIIISGSARGCLNSLNDKTVWNRGEWQTAKAEGWYKYGNVTDNGIEFMGPAACMEAYEELFDILQNYSGFNTTNPAHPDYRNHNQFLFRAYANGAGSGWAQNVFSGYNAGGVPDGNKMDGGWYRSLFTPSAVFTAGWTEYHEIGHIFDNASIGTSESTNNLYGLFAGTKFVGENRLDGGENRWWNHFTSYINTGVLPDNDLLFYPGAVIWQLNAVDFSETKLYNAPGDEKLSNYGMACRYYRTHKAELDAAFGGDKDSKLVVSFSMACGKDLSSHFEYYQRKVSDRAKRMLSGLTKETRNTWYVNDRTFKGGEFSQENKDAIWAVNYSKDSNGIVTITAPNDVFDQANLQCFEVTKYELNAEGTPMGEEIFVGISGEDKSTSKTELYTVIDRNIVPGATYRYTIKAYDNTLTPSNNPATFDLATNEDTYIPLVKMLINNGDEGMTMNMGNTYKLKLNYYPLYTTEDLNSIEWWIAGYGRDGEKTQGGEDIIMLKDDPDYPGDPTRKMIIGVQPGQTHVYVKFGGLTRNHRIVINGGGVEYRDFTFKMPDNTVNLSAGDKYIPVITRTDNADGQTTFIRATNPKIEIRSTNEGIVEVIKRVTSANDNTPVVEAVAVGAGTAKLEVYYNNAKQCEMTVNVAEQSIPLDSLEVVDLSNNQKEAYDLKDTIRLGVRYNPENATVSSKVLWSSSDTGIARVDSNGIVTPIKGGEVDITATVVIGGEAVFNSRTVKIINYVGLQRLSFENNQITLDTSSEGALGETTIIAKKVPENANATGILWESSNINVATVEKSDTDGNATIKAVGSGECVISAMLEGKKVSVKVTVVKPIELDNLHFLNRGAGTVTITSETIKIGSSVQFVVETEPVTATELSKIEWTSDKESVATVRQGLVTGISKGSATITGSVTQSSTGRTKTVTINVNVEENVVPLTGIGLNKANTTLQIGDEDSLNVNLRPVNTTTATKDDVEWTSSNEDIASVDENGRITAKAEGECTITATLGRFSATCAVTVAREVIPVEGIELSESIFIFEMSINEKATVTATVTPAEASQAVYYRVEDTSIATVSQSGEITAVSAGRTNLIVTGSGGYTVNATIEVLDHAHIIDTEYSVNEAYHWMRRCTDERCLTNLLPISSMYSYSEHNYVLEIANASTKKSDATANSPAVYYKSCECGVISQSETFVAGGTTPGETPGETGPSQNTPQSGRPYFPNSSSGTSASSKSDIQISGDTSRSIGVDIVGGNAIIDNITEDILSNVVKNGETEKTALTLDLSKAGVSIGKITLKTESLKAISNILKDKSNNKDSFEVILPGDSVSFDAAAVKAIVGSAKGENVEIEISIGASSDIFNASQKNAINAIDKKLGMQVESNINLVVRSAGKVISDFKGGNAWIGISSFKPQAGRKSSNYHVYFLSKDGALKRMVTWSKNGNVCFRTGHFSEYVIVYDEFLENGEAKAIYRLYNPNTGDHFFTKSKKEKEFCEKSGWKYEGIAFYTLASSKSVVYRLYNEETGEHFYTKSSKERDGLAKLGWKYEGEAFAGETISNVYRLYNPGGKHMYTASETEKSRLISMGWNYEGLAIE